MNTDLQEYFKSSGALSDEKLYVYTPPPIRSKANVAFERMECSCSILPEKESKDRSPLRRSFIHQPQALDLTNVSPVNIPSPTASPSLPTSISDVISPRRSLSERGVPSSSPAASSSNVAGSLSGSLVLPPASHKSPGRGPMLTSSMPAVIQGDNMVNDMRALKAELNRQRDELSKTSQEAERARMEVSTLQEAAAAREQKLAEVLAMAQTAGPCLCFSCTSYLTERGKC